MPISIGWAAHVTEECDHKMHKYTKIHTDAQPLAMAVTEAFAGKSVR